MSSYRAPVRCACCGKSGRHAGRGLIVSCHSRHTRKGTLDQWPPVAGNAEWQAAYRQPQTVDMVEPEGDWQERAACRSVNPEIFWPPTNTPLVLGRYLEQAAPVCGRCPVTEQCLAYALTTGQDNGIWGGTTPVQRRQMLPAATLERASA